eukprot:scaffold14838_cov129-Cylindrotheca_fusiformis.AAC.2
MPPLSPRSNQNNVTQMDYLEYEDDTFEHSKVLLMGTTPHAPPSKSSPPPPPPHGTTDPPPSSSSPFEVRRQVQFSEKLKDIRSTLHIRDYTFRERRETWYNLRDLQEIKKDRKETTKRMNLGLKCRRNQCRRGLEGSGKDIVTMRSQIITESIQAVMKEQALQDEERIVNPDRIAKAYVVHSLPSQMAAYERGLSYQGKDRAGSASNRRRRQDEGVSKYVEMTCSFLMESEDYRRDDIPEEEEEVTIIWKRSE